MAATLEDLLVQARVLSPVQVSVARRDAGMRNKRLAPTVIDLGLVDEVRFAQWMAEITRLPLVDPLPEDAAFELERRVPRAIGRELQVVPIALDGDQLTIATIDPTDAAALDVLRATTGLQIRPVVARYGDLMRLVDRFYPEDDAEPTILPAPFPSMGTVESGPFEVGSSTLMTAYSQPFSIGDESPGSSTQIITPRMTDREPPRGTSPEPSGSQLDRIEQTLQAMERRLDAIEARLADVLHRE